MSRSVSKTHLDRYFRITKEALLVARATPVKTKVSIDAKKASADILHLVECYVKDAEHFAKRGDVVLAFAALNYAHGLMDGLARLKIIPVKDSRLFIVDDE